jgi:DNA-binding transcriptional LysR family regulator
MRQSQAEPVRLPRAGAQAPQGLELRHLRYLTAVADAGTFTRAAERLFIAQPTLSQQIRRLEQLVGTRLLRRHRDGVQLTAAGTVLLDAARDVLSAVDHGVSQTRQAAGLGRLRLRFVVPAALPEALAVKTASALRSAAAGADVDVVWLETPLDAEFSPVRQHRADAGLGWLTDSPDALPAPLDAMSLGQFEPDLWIPRSHPAARRGTVSLGEMARMDVIHGPRRAGPGTYDAWTSIVRAVDPRFAFTDPPLLHSLPVVLAFAATADRATAVLTDPTAIAGTPPGVIRLPETAGTSDMVQVSIDGHPLTATVALVWNGDLPRQLQQILFDTADGLTRPAPASLSRAGLSRAGLSRAG